MNNKRIIISIILTLVLLISGTYAYIYFYTEKTDVTMMVDGDRISFNAGENVTVSGIMPVYTMEEGVVKDIEIYKENGKYTAGIDLYLKLTTWPTSFSSNSLRWALYKNNNFLSGGNFLGTKQGDSVKLTNYTQKINLEEDKDNYKLYIWIDAYTESSVDMMNQTFTVSIYGQASFYEGANIIAEPSIPNKPLLVDGMIPIRYNYIIDEWQKADTSNANNNWYDYDSKMWANAVLVTSESRDKYMSATEGITIDEKDILAYYVWIPRYKYLLFNVNSEASSPREIQIVFEKETDPISSGDENGKYLSHPAFWWDNDSNNIRAEDGSEELSGIWVGKFETSGAIGSPKILPNVPSSTNMNVKSLYDMNKGIQTTSYLTETGVTNSDAHMIKNTDWGAVAYLSYSRFGINKSITVNNSYVTGRQGNYTYNDFLVSNNTITLTKLPGTGTSTSTTGNISGVYDMSGCGGEYVMGVRKTSDTITSPPYYNNSGFNASTMPQLKYYNLYEYVSSSNDYTKRILGDATGETNGWHSGHKNFLSSKYGWFIRGYYNTGIVSGIFNFDGAPGVAYGPLSSRGVLLTP